MKKFRFEYNEVSIGFIDVWAENEDDALEKAHCADGDVFINKSEIEIGMKID